MRRLFVALAALFLLLLTPPAEARPRHGCAPGEAALKGGGCATLRPRSGAPLPAARACLGGGTADALGRCPRRFCANGLSPDASGRCQRAGVCANGRTPDALGQCGLQNLCPNGDVAVRGLCPPLSPCVGYGCGAAPAEPGSATPLRGTARPVTPQIAPSANVPNIAPAAPAGPLIAPRP